MFIIIVYYSFKSKLISSCYFQKEKIYLKSTTSNAMEIVMRNKFLTIAAFSGFFCVAFGAFTAHALEKMLSPNELIWIEKGLKYQMFHTLALLGLGLFQIANFSQNPPTCRAKAFNLIGGSWCLGILLFSGSLYALALGASKLFVWTTPIGGTLFLVGWGILIYLSVRSRNV